MPKKVKKNRKVKDNSLKIILDTMKMEFPGHLYSFNNKVEALRFFDKQEFEIGLSRIPAEILNMTVGKYQEMGGNISDIIGAESSDASELNSQQPKVLTKKLQATTPATPASPQKVVKKKSDMVTPHLTKPKKQSKGKTPAVINRNLNARTHTKHTLALPNNKLMVIDENTDSMPAMNSESHEALLVFKKRLSMLLRQAPISSADASNDNSIVID